MSLFQSGSFTSHSGLALPFKIECDALTDEDWRALAAIAAPILPPFSQSIGVPTGGLPLADAMLPYRSHHPKVKHWVICDDVLTTGASMEAVRAEYSSKPARIIGLVAFARGDWPSWVTPIFALHGCKQKAERDNKETER